ncbi:GIY-YIG nuclease family protein [Acinetobacter haemolyticus]|uniref:GIY-YIG nuclease family protein n=1 Tax=Acinetobacter haemolyticus TaxID=29430 RepID=UPI0013728BE3|nr:GIY-YIG nuclease family protein [Acinetobacter haemolyticus]NAR60987.1 GIY-YIG nuclease family protein [Acinetobacter haemolyticus]NAR66979.1 GIY-YIG nuclease family protein [Acinetobacter haemolyticus]NAR70631.1 GIY-YIG nuclease family protein [Acinetobacter haemolyticus]NAR83276.1 GIY-YIG nuclease family protein [Acinetobacter haemolyticus]NAR93255.1 GIY-YIG nuclease family protein [Acinetobacter haemolyticus]
MADISDDDLLSELGIDLAPVKQVTYTAKEERLISGFEEVIQFYEINQRIPSNSNNADIFERLYAVRLDQLRKLPEAMSLLEDLDQHNLLNSITSEPSDISELEDDDLLSELGIEVESEDNILVLQHVRSQKEREANELTATRKACAEFDVFKGIFDQISKELEDGLRITKPFGKDASIELHDWFIVDGQIVYVAEIGEYFKAPNGENDARLRAIYSNGTESNLLMRSLKKALNTDKAGRRILVAKNTGPLFSSANLSEQDTDIEVKSGSIYVLRSLSDNDFIKANKHILHKIGVTTGKVNQRITEAKKDPTYLLADVELVATYSLPENIVPQKLEKLIHKILQSAQLDIVIEDRFGNPVKPKEWFLVPLNIIDQIIARIKDSTLDLYSYNPVTGTLEKNEA